MTIGSVLVEVRFGSHLYGTATPASDVDLKAVHVPPARDILLQRAVRSVTDNTKADATTKNTAADTDRESWALHHFFRLLAEGQVVALDLLFAPPGSWVAASDSWEAIHASRGALVSRRCTAFLGYCHQQAARYGIKGSRMAAAESALNCLGPILEQNPRARLGDFGPAIETVLGGIEHIGFPMITGGGGAEIRHLEVCGRKAPYTASLRDAHAIFARLYEQYGERARAAKNSEGIDWKAMSHAVRVGHQALELLRTGTITFPRPDAKRLVMIKTGQIPYRDVALEIEALLELVERAAAASLLPVEPNVDFMDRLTVAAYSAAVIADRA